MFANDKMRENSGRLIKIYRERRHQRSKDKQFSCNEFILATKEHPFYEIIEGAPVCSRATLNRLERGQSIKDDDLYIFFIQKLGFQVDDFPGIMSNVERISEELYTAVEMYDVDRISSLKKQIDIIFEKARYYFYYKEVYTALVVITNYYLDAKYPSNEEADKLYLTCFILNKKVDELLSNILFDHYYYKVMNMVLAEKLYNKLTQFNNGSRLSTLFIAEWLMYKERWFAALNEVKDGINYFKEKKVNYHLGVLYFTQAMALHTGNKEDVQPFFDYSINCLENSRGNLAHIKLVNNYFNIGFQYYFDKKYTIAGIYFNKFLDNNPPFTIHMLYVLNCAELLNDQNLLSKLAVVNFVEEKNCSLIRTFYNYFRMKLMKVSEKELENYIIHNIFEVLLKEYRSDNLINFFKNELMSMVKITKHYKVTTLLDNFTSHKID